MSNLDNKNNFKINDKYLSNIQLINNKNIFGNWINDITDILTSFQNAKPYEYVIIPNFLNDDYANFFSEKFPIVDNSWHKYNNPFEVKYAFDNINTLDPILRDLFYHLSTDKLIKIFSDISNIPNLAYDPYLHGAGLHLHPRNGRLGMHLDYEKHPYLENRERRLNIILYLNKEWKDEWNGATELWNEDMSECKVKSPIRFNTAIVFRTNDISWHGVPEKILCPENMMRKSFAYYYISPLESKALNNKFGNDGSGYRTKATFIKRSEDPENEKMDKLYKIRPYRLITQKDMDEIWPEWNSEDF
jgi:hypothetical protein